MNTFTRSVDLLSRAMDVNSLRYQVSANNIANAEVPNYKRQTVSFESELKKAFESEKDTEHRMQLTTTNDSHIQIEQPYDWKSVEPRRVTDWASTANANGNNVDPEYEAMNIMKIQLNYRLLAQLENFEFSQVKTAMKR
ncbi:flagellar basal body rod protein FlgB [Treponema sp.]|uniref:flagellar basal body rod protein FlgB n=1 Tax=Treponema sp. TaxID=166 RepID=UPI0025CFC3B4|nr:flagellar basal body rod protein FlgB [Treponema sp.]MBR4321221.1 flagellar basal body rod protein FlgB [Treponema sp.]